eukprot:7964704-Lingulodinium_polyedra.AAC.1
MRRARVRAQHCRRRRRCFRGHHGPGGSPLSRGADRRGLPAALPGRLGLCARARRGRERTERSAPERGRLVGRARTAHRQGR